LTPLFWGFWEIGKKAVICGSKFGSPQKGPKKGVIFDPPWGEYPWGFGPKNRTFWVEKTQNPCVPLPRFWQKRVFLQIQFQFFSKKTVFLEWNPHFAHFKDFWFHSKSPPMKNPKTCMSA
jgi:hypothetical protein